MPEIYIVNLDVDYEGTLESYVFFSREEADAKFDLMVKEWQLPLDQVVMYKVEPGTDYLHSAPLRRSNLS